MHAAASLCNIHGLDYTEHQASFDLPPKTQEVPLFFAMSVCPNNVKTTAPVLTKLGTVDCFQLRGAQCKYFFKKISHFYIQIFTDRESGTTTLFSGI
jgi:hypothetical protein